MIEIVTNKALIAKYQKKFLDQLRTICKEKFNCIVGHQSESGKFVVHYSKSLNIWFASYNADNRFWNAFGLQRPNISGGSNSITVEINFPYNGIDRRIGGAFGHEENGEVMVLHRGRIGGGKTGIGKQLFSDNFYAKAITVNDDDRINDLFIIGNLNSKKFPNDVKKFVNEVQRIKALLTK